MICHYGSYLSKQNKTHLQTIVCGAAAAVQSQLDTSQHWRRGWGAEADFLRFYFREDKVDLSLKTSLPAWLLQQSMEVTSIVGCLHSIMSTANRGRVL